MRLSDPDITPTLPHFYFLLQPIIDQGPIALLNFSNSDILYLIENAKIPQVERLAKKATPEEKNFRENLQSLLRDLIQLSSLLNLDFLLKAKQDLEIFNVRASSDTYIAFSGHRKIIPLTMERPEISPEIREKLPNLLKVSVVGAKLTPILASLFSSSIKEESNRPISTNEAQVIHWPSLTSDGEYMSTTVATPSSISKQVEAVLHEAEGLHSSTPPTALKTPSIPRKASQNNEPLRQLKAVLQEIDSDTRNEFDLFLQLLKTILEGLIAPVPVLVEKIPRELINPMISISGLLEDIGGQSYRNISTSLFNWLISLVAYFQEEPLLGDYEWEDRGRALIEDGKSLSNDILNLLSDPWLQSWIKSFTDHFMNLKDTLASRVPPLPPMIEVFQTSNLYSVFIALRDWGEFLLFSLPQYLSTLSWQFPLILFPHWFKESVKGPYPRIEFRQKKVHGWVDEVKSIKGTWSLALQAIARVYPREDPFITGSNIGPWTPGLRKAPLLSTNIEPISRWFVHIDASRLVVKDTRYFFKYRSRWLTFGIKKKSYADSGRLDIEIGKEMKKMVKGQGISIKMELGVPSILAAPLVAQQSPLSGVTLTGIRVNINQMKLSIKSEKHPKIYPMILPFATSAIKRRIETLIEKEAIRIINS